MKSITYFFFTLAVLIFVSANLNAQEKEVLVDVGHGQRFYSDPADNISTNLVPTDRLKYMTGELTKNAASGNASIGYIKSPITPASLAKAKMLFIHCPSSEYSTAEVSAIDQFVNKGGSLFIVMEEDYWAKLDQSNVNDIVSPFSIMFKSDNPDKTSGGHSLASPVTKLKYSIPSHGARIVEGGKPFAYLNDSDKTPVAVYATIKGGGKVIAMGEGMVSLYMTSWQGVNNYQCAEFMGEAVGWLLK